MAWAITAVKAVAASFSATLTAGGTGAFLLRTVSALALSALSQALLKPKGPPPAGIRTATTMTGGVNPEGFILGEYATEGALVAPPMTHGSAGGTPNAYLNYVVEFGGIPGQQVEGFIIDGEYVPIHADIHSDYGRALGGSYHNRAWFRYYDGTQTEADAMLLAKYPAPHVRPWLPDMVGEGICYVVFTFRYDREIFRGFPRFRVVFRGARLLDPRIGTEEYTRNPVQMIWHTLRGVELPGGHVWGGEAEDDDLPAASWEAAMDECDLMVADGDGGTEPQFEAGWEVLVDDEPYEVIDELLKACMGNLRERGGVWDIRVGPPGLPVMFLDDGQILVSEPRELDPFPRPDETYNAITATHPDPEALWENREAPPLYNLAWEAEDDNRRLPAQLDLSAVSRSSQVQRIMSAMAKDNRRMLRHVLPIRPNSVVPETGDVIAWNSDRNGYTGQGFEVWETVRDLRTGLVALSVREVDPDDFDPPDTIKLPSPVDSTPDRGETRTIPETEWNVEGVTVYDGAGIPRRPGLRVVWNPETVEDARQIEYEIETNPAPHEKVTRGLAAPQPGEKVTTDGIVPATGYRARLRPVIPGRTTDWTQWKTATSPDVRLEEADLGDIIRGRIQDAQDEAAQAAQDAQDAFTAAQAAQDAVEGIDQQLLDDIQLILDELDGVDLEDIQDARHRAIIALRDGWIADPTFQEWEGGNLKGTNWATRTGVATYGTQQAEEGKYRSSLYVDIPASSNGTVSVIASSETDGGLLGADPDAEYVTITLLVDFIEGDPVSTRFRADWRLGSGSWVPGEMLGQTVPLGNFAQHGITVKPGVFQGRGVVVKRPAGTFDQLRLWLNVNVNSTADAYKVRFHALNIREATEAEIEAYEADAKTAAAIDAYDMTITGPTGALTTLAQSHGSRLDTAESNITSIQATKVDASGAVSAVNATISSAVGNTVAEVAQRATTAVNRTGEIYARQYLGATTSDGATASLELIAFNAGTGGSSASAIMLNADNIFLDGTVSLPKLVVTDFSGNLVPNGDFRYGDLRGWSGGLQGFTVQSPSAPTPPTQYVLRHEWDGQGRFAQFISEAPAVAGDRFAVSYWSRRNAAGAGPWRIWFQFLDADGEVVASAVRDHTPGVTWAAHTTTDVIAPTGTAKMNGWLHRVDSGGPSGLLFLSKLEVIRQRAGTTLITPNSITGQLVVADEALIGKLQAVEAWIGSANIGEAEIDTAHIKDLAVDTLKIAGRAVTDPQMYLHGSFQSLGGAHQSGVVWFTEDFDYSGSNHRTTVRVSWVMSMGANDMTYEMRVRVWRVSAPGDVAEKLLSSIRQGANNTAFCQLDVPVAWSQSGPLRVEVWARSITGGGSTGGTLLNGTVELVEYKR